MLEEDKFSTYPEFGRVPVDSSNCVASCEMRIGFRRTLRDRKTEHYTIIVKIEDRMDVSSAIAFALNEAKARFKEMYPDAELTEFP